MNTHDPAFWQFWINVMDFIIHALIVILTLGCLMVVVKLHKEMTGKK